MNLQCSQFKDIGGSTIDKGNVSIYSIKASQIFKKASYLFFRTYIFEVINQRQSWQPKLLHPLSMTIRLLWTTYDNVMPTEMKLAF